MDRDPQETLHLRAGATPEEIQQSYRDLVRVWHPDRFANDPRLQKIAEEKLREINAAYVALASEASGHPQPPPSRALLAKPSRWSLHPDTARALWLAVALAAAALLLFLLPSFLLPMFRARPTVTAPPAPLLPVPGAAVSRSTHTAPRASSPALFRPGVGQIQLYNLTGEDTRVILTSSRPHSSAARTVTIPVAGDLTLDDLGPDLYLLKVTFPNSRHPDLRLGPFVMVQTESAAGRTGDRYEITLRAQGDPQY